MKERITGLALVLAMLLFSACGAWAAVTQLYSPVLRINTTTIPDVMKGDTTFIYSLDIDSEDLISIDWTASPQVKEGISFDLGLGDDGAATAGVFRVDENTGPTKVGSFTFAITAVGHYHYITGASYMKSADQEGEEDYLYVPSEDRTITVKKNFTIKVKPWGPSALSLDMTDAPATGMEEESDLDEIIDTAKKAGMVAGISSGDLANVKFRTKATLPVVLTAKNLPAGITAHVARLSENGDGDLVRAENAETANGSDDIEIYFTGMPTKSGNYNNITINVSNTSIGGSQVMAGPFTMRVFEPAKTTTKKLPDVTWGKSFSTKLTSTGGMGTDFVVSWDKALTAEWVATIGPGISFDAATGTFFGVIGSTDIELSNDYTAKVEEGESLSNDLRFNKAKNVTMTIRFLAHTPTGSVKIPDGSDSTYNSADKDGEYGVEYEFKLIGVSPAIMSKDTMQASFDALKLYIGNDGKVASATATTGENSSKPANRRLPGNKKADGETTAPSIKFKANGPGTFTWSHTKLPYGFFTSEDLTDNSISLYASGDAQALKNYGLTFTAANGIGKDSFTLRINLATSSDIDSAFKISADFMPFGVYKVGDSFDMPSCDLRETEEQTARPGSRSLPGNRRENEGEATYTAKVPLEAYPGPIKWTVKNLPRGITLSIDKSVSFDSKVWLKGRFEKATAKNLVYTVTAKNTVYGTSSVISRSITVYEEPGFKTKTILPPLTLGKAYNTKLDTVGIDVSLDVFFTAVKEITYNASTTAKKAASHDEVIIAAAKAQDDYAGEGEGFGEDSKVFNNNDQPNNSGLKYEASTNRITGTLDVFPGPTNKSDDFYGYVIVTARINTPAYKYETDALSKDFILPVKGVAPKFITGKLPDYEGTGSNVDENGENHVISISGTHSMDILAYIAAADAKKLGFNVTDNIPIADADADNTASPSKKNLPSNKRDGNDAASATPTFTYTKDESDTNVKLKIGYAGNQGFALSGLPITISADNGASKPVVKVYKVNVTGATPMLVSSDGESELSRDITVSVLAGTAIPAITIKSGGDKPLVFSWTGQGRDFTVTSADDTDNNLPKVTINGTPKAGKESKTTITVTLTNPQTKKKYARKIVIAGMLAPDLSGNKTAALTKEIEFGKNMSFKLAVKGSKPITWSISSPDYVVALGLSFDAKTGMLKGKATNTTSKDNKYYPKTFTITATNDAGAVSKDVTIGVKGLKPKLGANTIVLQIQSKDLSLSGDTIMKTNIAHTDKNSFVRWALYNDKVSETKLNGLVVGTSGTRNYGSMDLSAFGNGDDKTKPVALKNATVKVSIDNIGSTINGNVKVVVRDPAPYLGASENPVTVTAQEKSTTTKTVTIAVSGDTMTGDTSMKWTLATKPGGNVKAAMKIAADKKSVTVTLTIPKGLSSKDIPSTKKTEWGNIYKTYFAVAAQNTLTREATTMRVSIDITPYDVTVSSGGEDSGEEGNEGAQGALPAENDAKPEETAAEETLSADELPVGEGTVIYGEAREESALTEAERTALSEGGYIIAAILPEITTDESGQYDLAAVSLDEAAPEGYELVWFAFPRRAESSDDDAIAEFYDEAGAEVFAVPEGRKVVPSPWLEKEVTYAPVIAVKAPSAGNAKTSFDQAEEGDTVTVQAIEEAAETTADSEAEPEVISEEAKHEEASSEAPAEE